jgi:predicted nucleic acid-binding protein
MKKFTFSEAATDNYVDEICGEFEVSNLSPTITKSALNLKSRYGISWFDSLIVAAALVANCSLLYTEDLQNGMVFEGRLKVVNPFK